MQVQQRYVWAIFKWIPDEMLWRFNRYWGDVQTNPSSPNRIYTDPTASLKGPPGYSSVFSGLKADEAVFFVPYPEVSIKRELLFHSLDWRFNPDVEEP